MERDRECLVMAESVNFLRNPNRPLAPLFFSRLASAAINNCNV